MQNYAVQRLSHIAIGMQLLLVIGVLTYAGTMGHLEQAPNRQTHSSTRRQSKERDSVRLFRALAPIVRFNKPLLFQVEYSDTLVPKYGVRPVNGIWAFSKNQNKEKWTITVEMEPSVGEAKVRVLGNRLTRPDSTEARKTNRAVEIAARTLDEAGLLSFPFMISVDKHSRGWSITFTRVPPILDGDRIVEVSANLKTFRIVPGL